jgi:hypothetical protein
VAGQRDVDDHGPAADGGHPLADRAVGRRAPLTPPARFAIAASTRKQAVNQKLLHNSPVVAYREHRCLGASLRPSPSFAKGHGEGRPGSDTLKVSSSTSRPQPETRKHHAHGHCRARPAYAHRE